MASVPGHVYFEKIIAFLDILTLLFNVWSIWYQGVKAKPWCVRCNDDTNKKSFFYEKGRYLSFIDILISGQMLSSGESFINCELIGRWRN